MQLESKEKACHSRLRTNLHSIHILHIQNPFVAGPVPSCQLLWCISDWASDADCPRQAPFGAHPLWDQPPQWRVHSAVRRCGSPCIPPA